MVSENRNINETIVNIFLSIIVLAVIVGVCLFVLSQMNIQSWNYYKDTCDKYNGTLITYECYNNPMNAGFCDLDTTKKGQYCELNNGSEIDITIKNVIA